MMDFRFRWQAKRFLHVFRRALQYDFAPNFLAPMQARICATHALFATVLSGQIAPKTDFQFLWFQ
jgi:hypothetical protein